MVVMKAGGTRFEITRDQATKLGIVDMMLEDIVDDDSAFDLPPHITVENFSIIYKFLNYMSSLDEEEAKAFTYSPSGKCKFIDELSIGKLLSVAEDCNYLVYDEMTPVIGYVISTKARDIDITTLAKIIGVDYNPEDETTIKLTAEFGRYLDLEY